MYQFSEKEKNTLKEMAALQFPGSKDNISTKAPIHFVLEQCGEYVPSTIDADVDDADSGDFFFSLNNYESDNGDYGLSNETASGLVLNFLGITENEVGDYNKKAKQKEDVQFVTFGQAMKEQSIPGWPEDVYDLEDYFNAYGIEMSSVEITRRTDSWHVKDISFTHKGANALMAKTHKESPKDVRLYASTETEGDYPIIAKYRLDVPAGLLGNNEPANAIMCVYASGCIKENNGYEYPICSLRVTLECGSFQKECSYPFARDAVGKHLGSSYGIKTLFNYIRFC